MGEILVLFGTFEDHFVYGVVASVGVVLAAVYMIRAFQKAMHDRVGGPVRSADLTGVGLLADRAAGGS